MRFASLNGTIRMAVPVFISAGLFLAMTMALQDVNRQRGESSERAELSYLPRGEYLKLAVFGYQEIVADMIWLKAVQQYAGRDQTREGYLSAYHATDVATDLSPNFVHAYKASGTILTVWAHMPNKSVAILKKGLEHNPSIWELPFFIGYDYYYELRDPVSAAKYFQQAATLPGAPSWLPGLATRMTVQAGNLDAAAEFLQRLYQSAADERMRETLVQRMKEVESERRIQMLERAVKEYAARFGVLPKQMQELTTSGILPVIPEDPLGGQYRLRESDGAIFSSNPRERLRVYEERAS